MMNVEDTLSTSGDVQYIEGYHDECGGYLEYIRGCSVHHRGTMSTSGGYHEYTGDVQYIRGIS